MKSQSFARLCFLLNMMAQIKYDIKQNDVNLYASCMRATLLRDTIDL